MRAALHRFSLPLRQPLPTGAGAIERREGFLLELEDDAGHRGWGEAAPLPGFPGGSLEQVEGLLRRWCAEPVAAVRAELGSVSIAAAAVDTALMSMDAARQGMSLAQHLAGGDVPSVVDVNALVGAGPDIEASVAAALDARAAGYRTVKVKVGAAPVAQDQARVVAIRDAVGPDIGLRLDANRSWTHEQAVVALRGLAELGIEYVEEPTADLERWPELARQGVPLAADESLSDPGPDRVLSLIREGHVAALIAKIPLLYGVRPTLAAAGVASARGGRVVVTSFLDSAVGLAAATHLAAALGPRHGAAGLATGQLLAHDVAETACVHQGQLPVPTGPGLGVTPDLEALVG